MWSPEDHEDDIPCESQAEQSRAGDGLQLTLRFSFQPRLTPGVRRNTFLGGGDNECS